MEKKENGPIPQFNPPVNIEFSRYGTEESCVLGSVDNTKSLSGSDFQAIVDICSEKLIYDVLFKERLKGKPYTKKDAEKFASWAQEGWEKEEYFVFLIRNQAGEIIARLT